MYFLCKGVPVRPGVVGNLFPVFYRVKNDGCFPASDAGSEPGAVTENHSHVQVMMSLPGFLGLAGFFVEAGESCFVLATDGGVDRRVAPDDFAGGELVGALEGLIGFMQCRQGLHRLSCFLFRIVPFKLVLIHKSVNDCILKVVAICFDC